MEARIEPVIRTRIREAYFLIRRLDVGVNPVRKVQLTIYGVADQVCIDELADAIDEGGDGAGGGGGVHGGPRNGVTDSSEHQHQQQLLMQLQTLKLQLSSMQHALEAASLGGFRSVVGEQFLVVNRNINQVAAQPAVQRGRLNVGLNGGGSDSLLVGVELSPHPKYLADLWTEYLHGGIGGRKAAKDFTLSERGHWKLKYCRRKAVWQVIARLVNAGYSTTVAIHKIRAVYGDSLSVSKVIAAIVKDKGGGGHPNLWIGSV